MERYEQNSIRVGKYGFAMSPEFLEIVEEHDGDLYEQLISWSPNGIGVIDTNGRLIFSTPQTAAMHGYENAGSLLEENFENLFAAEHRDEVSRRLNQSAALPVVDEDFTLQRKDGSTYDGQVSIAAMNGRDGQPTAYISLIKDVTEMKQKEAELRDMMDNAADGILIAGAEGEILYANESIIEMSGYSRGELLGRLAMDVVHIEDEEEPLAITQIMQGETIRRERTAIRKDGAHFPVDVSARLMANGKIFATIRDVTERQALLTQIKEQSEHMKHQAEHDELTGLFNRRYFMKKLEELEQSRQYPIGFMMLDLDGLKETNDTYGHHAGDELIQQTAQILRETFRRSDDRICRIGGDEFVVVVTQANEEFLQDTVESLKIELTEAGIHASAGISVKQSVLHEQEPFTLYDTFQEADSRMYQEKYSKRTNHK